MSRTQSLVALLPVLALLASTGWFLHDAGYLTRAGIVALAADSGPWAPAILVALMVLAVVIGPIPTVPISVASGIAFGPLAGFAYAMIGALLGAAASFGIARLVGRPFVQRLFHGHIAFCATCSSRLLFWVVLAARLVPVVSFAFVSYGAGLTAMRLTGFLAATALGMIPMTALYVAAGSAITVAPATAALGGAIALLLTLALPRLVERFNPLGLRDRLAQAHSSRAPGGD